MKSAGIIDVALISDPGVSEAHERLKPKETHFQCIQCQKIQEYDDPYIFKEMLRQKEYIEETYQDIIDDITIVTKGTCKDCGIKALFSLST